MAGNREARAVAGLVAAVVVAAGAALVLGEYELRGWVPVVAGVVVGALVGDVLCRVGGVGGVVPAVVGAVLAAGSLVWAGWLDSSEGVARYPAGAWVGAALAAATAAGLALRPRTTRTPGPDNRPSPGRTS